MISVAGPCLSLSLFYPSSSLVRQIDECTLEERPLRIRVLEADGNGRSHRMAEEAAAAILDATERPKDVAAAMEQVAAVLGPARTLVYTEETDVGLEIFTRSLGVHFTMGPMDLEEWDAWLARLAAWNQRLVKARPLPGCLEQRFRGMGIERTSP